MAIPYMGSKSKLAKPIVQHILQHNPKCEHVYDLFGGGAAISEEFLKQGKKVHYNELNTGVCNLLRKIQIDGITDEFFNWVSREEFNENKGRDNWKGGLIKCCWSFGNNQKDYLFGKDIEELKRTAHEYLFANGYDRTAESRTRLLKQFKQEQNIIDRFDLQQLERLERLQRLERLERLQRLQRLERLERLEQLERLEGLEITNLSYELVPITTPIESTIIYLDPPYFQTAKYAEGHGLNYEELYKWIRESPYKVYMSEYNAPFECVKEFVHRCTLSPTANNKKIERLFCNQSEKIKTTLF
jgi:site-specific DNA-adenine methylase